MKGSVRFATMLGLVAAVAACGDDTAPPDETPPEEVPQSCQVSSQEFARRVIPAVLGRRPWGQAEVMAVADALDAVEGQGLPRLEAQRLVAQALTHDPAYIPHWGQFLMDTLRVRRKNIVRDSVYKNVQAARCYDTPGSGVIDDGSLAAWVRDHYPSASDPPVPAFTLGALQARPLGLRASLEQFRAEVEGRA